MRERERERERSMGRGQTRVNDTEGMTYEERKSKGKRESEKVYHEREKTPKNCVSHGYKRR